MPATESNVVELPKCPSGCFTEEQKEYLAGFMAGVAQGGLSPSASVDSGPNPAPPAEETIHGTPLADVTKQERWKHEEHGLDSWDRILEHVQADKFPDEENTFRMRFHGLFHVAPAQKSFMLRCRIPAGELTSAQLQGLAGIADEFGNGKAAITTRSNIQIREIAPRSLVNVLTRLQSLGLTSKGSGVDNVRNITASPTAGIDPQELLDTRPYAHSLHHYILNHRDLYDLPRKFNVAFEGGGSVDTVADTNDIGFVAVRVRAAVESSNAEQSGPGLVPPPATEIEPGIYFRVDLCGITGHKQLARDSGLLVKPTEAVAVAVAMIRVFIEHGDRTDRKKARLKYLIDKWGLEKFLAETQQKLAFPLVRFPLDQCAQRPPALKHGHIGVYRQSQRGRNYIGVVIPVVLALGTNTPVYSPLWHALPPFRFPRVPERLLPIACLCLAALLAFAVARTRLAVLVLIACTGNTGCKWAATDTKGQAVKLAEHLGQRVALDQPVNIHLTGCPNSCAQHYVGDIGLQGVKVGAAGVEGYNIVFGGGTGALAGIGREVFKGISFDEVPRLLERVLKTYLARRNAGESFTQFTRRHDVKVLQELFSE